MKTEEAFRAEKRAALYASLSSLYGPPGWEMITRGMDRLVQEHGEMLFHPEMRGSLADLVGRLEKESYERDLKEFQDEYARLFYPPPRGEFIAPPVASYYLNRKATLRPSKRLLACWQELVGGRPPGFGGSIPDSIQEELGFLGLLCEGEARARNQDQPHIEACLMKEHWRFLASHLSLWIHKFTQRLQTGTHLAFYQVLAHATCNFVCANRRMLAARLNL